ncbi:MAG: glycosyltransferase family 4 protein [Candidatus Paceibacterota bacterium]
MKIFLFDPTCLSYRIHVYKYFVSNFREKGIELTIYYDKDRAQIDEEHFKPIGYYFSTFYKLHIKEKPQISIFFIWLSYKWSLPFLIWMRMFMKTKSIVWSKGINITNVDQPLKNTLYYIRQFAADGLILYSDFERQFIKTSQQKVFVAYNTINQHVYKKTKLNKDDLREKYGITHRKNVLFLGRIEKRKRVDLLIDAFSSELKEYGLIIIGPGLEGDLKREADHSENIYHFGPIYDTEKLSEFYTISDLFCIPGHIGLAVNESFLYGLPVVTADVHSDHALVSSEPIMLLEDGYNGRYFDPEKGNLGEILRQLLENDDLRLELSKNAKDTFYKKAKIEYMNHGFLNAINYVINK